MSRRLSAAWTPERVLALAAGQVVIDLPKAADTWGISEEAAYALARTGDLPFVAHRVGTRWLVSTAELVRSHGLVGDSHPEQQMLSHDLVEALRTALACLLAALPAPDSTAGAASTTPAGSRENSFGGVNRAA